MTSDQSGWLLLLVLSVLLIIMGIQGSLGLFIGIVFTPQYILIGDEMTGAF